MGMLPAARSEALCRSNVRSYQGSLPTLQQSYPAIKAPSLFLWAGQDKHFPVAHGRQLGSLVPKAQVEEIPEAEHWMALYLAEQVSARISRFLGTSDVG